jgi:hypothetical protein
MAADRLDPIIRNVRLTGEPGVASNIGLCRAMPRQRALPGARPDAGQGADPASPPAAGAAWRGRSNARASEENRGASPWPPNELISPPWSSASAPMASGNA